MWNSYSHVNKTFTTPGYNYRILDKGIVCNGLHSRSIITHDYVLLILEGDSL